MQRSLINTLPIGVQVLACITAQLDTLHPVFKNKNKTITSLKQIITEKKDLDTHPNFKDHPLQIQLLQTLMILSLSMYGGISIPCIKQFSYEKNKVKIKWDSGVTDHFHFGICDEAFSHFSLSYQNRLSTQKLRKRHIPCTIYRGIYQFLFSNKKVLDACNERFNTLIHTPSPITSLLQKKQQNTQNNTHNDDLIFLLISALPNEDINALFLYVQRFFPDDLKVRSQNGNTVNVKQCFQSTSSSYNYLMEKNNIYLELYYSHDKPIIKHITQAKTLDFLDKLRLNPKSNNQLIEHLKKCQSQQIEFRLNLLKIFMPLLDKICG
eukprot:COSAG01_NODE_3_length_63519_cov_1591.007663_24_plen_323_part_00